MADRAVMQRLRVNRKKTQKMKLFPNIKWLRKKVGHVSVLFYFYFFLFFLHINSLLLFFPSFFSSPILLAPFFLLTNPCTNSAGAWVILEYEGALFKVEVEER